MTFDPHTQISCFNVGPLWRRYRVLIRWYETTGEIEVEYYTRKGRLINSYKQKPYGLIKINDAETIAAAVAMRALQDVKTYIHDDAPDVYQRWDNDADRKRGNWARQAFRDALNATGGGIADSKETK